MSRYLYGIPLRSLNPAESRRLETVHRVGFLVSLGIPKFARKVAILVEAENFPFKWQVNGRALRHMERTHRTASAFYLLCRYPAQPRTRVGRLAAKLNNLKKASISLPPVTPTHTSLRTEILSVEKKAILTDVVLRSFLTTFLNEEFS